MNEPDHEELLEELKFMLDFAKVYEPRAYGEIERRLRRLIDEYDEEIFGEGTFSECPVIREAGTAISRTQECLQTEKPADTNKCEYYSIGENYTFHTHPRGTPQPSEQDIETTKKLNKEWLMLGLVPQKKVVGVNLVTGERCEHPIV